MKNKSEVSIEDQIACVKRELLMRGRVYARQVDQGKMSNEKAGYELRAMGAVLQTLEDVKRAQDLLRAERST